MPRVVAALSGGVDSAVAAALSCERGDEVIGMTLRLYDAAPRKEASHGSCCAPEDIDDARRVAEQLGIPFYLLNGVSRFRAAVIEPFVEAYRVGRTPLPCAACNRELKFGHLLERARAIGARLCTGHYARIERTAEGRYRLLRARDERRDQSYFLYGLTQEQLAQLDFPLGGLLKDDVRAMAAERRLGVAAKPDSQEICFLGGGSYTDLLERLGGSRAGEMVDEQGAVLGHHQGVHRFTVGQRRGLPVLSQSGASREPLYVQRIDGESGRVDVGTVSGLLRQEIEVANASYPQDSPSAAFEALVRIRHQHRGEVATVTPLPARRARILFRSPVRAAAPGQAAVFYQGDEMVGGGTIQ
jgi:tRNA-uridine 2-sulfurtransferase